MTQRLPQRIRCQSDKFNNKLDPKKPTYIALSDAAKILILDNSTIRYHIIRKKIRAFKSGGKWYVNSDDVQTMKQTYDHHRQLD